MKQIWWLVLLINLLMLIGECKGPTINNQMFISPQTPVWTDEPSQMIKRVLSAQEEYLGKEITVEGVLEAKGHLPYVRFFLCGSEGECLEVSPWAPIEVIHPPEGEAKVKSMATFVGRHLRLTGTLDIGSEGIILKISSVEELGP